MRQFSFGKIKGNTKSSSFGMFARDNVTNKLSHDARKQKRIFKTQNAMRKLKKATEERSAALQDQTEGSDTGFSDSAFSLGNVTRSINLRLQFFPSVSHRWMRFFLGRDKRLADAQQNGFED